MKEPSDEKLMSWVASGDLDKLKVLFQRHQVYVYNFLYKMSNDGPLSEDLTQEVFYKVMKYRSSYNQGKFTSWLFAIARNSLRRHFSRNKETFVDLAQYQDTLGNGQEADKEEYSHLRRAMEKLNPSDKELLILNRFQKIKYTELAEITGSTPGAVKTRVSRALKRLKAIYFETL